jgi:hypothetical protein
MSVRTGCTQKVLYKHVHSPMTAIQLRAHAEETPDPLGAESHQNTNRLLWLSTGRMVENFAYLIEEAAGVLVHLAQFYVFPLARPLTKAANRLLKVNQQTATRRPSKCHCTYLHIRKSSDTLKKWSKRLAVHAVFS